MTATAARSQRAFLIVGLALPLLIIVLGALVVLAWMPELPDPIATHWGFDGADGFGPKWSILGLSFGVGGGIILLMGALVFWGAKAGAGRRTQWSHTTRFLGATSLAMSCMITFIAVVTTNLQRGLSDARDTPDINGWMLLGFAVLLLGGVIGWFLQPAAPANTVAPVDAAQPLTLGDAERAVWLGSATLSRVGWVVLGALHAALLGLAVFMLARGHMAGWILVGEFVLVALLFCSMMSFRVRASAKGLAVRSILGWPRVTIPASDIAQASVVDIAPLGDFGGWGYRFAAGGRSGVVLRRGEALEVTRRNGKRFVVTVDDATTAAAVLAAGARAAS